MEKRFLRRGLALAAVGLAAALALIAGCASAPRVPAPGQPVTVTFLTVNDFHGALDESSRATGNPGAAKLAGSVEALTAQAPQTTIVVSAGDNYQGSAVSNLNRGKPVSDMFRAMGVRYSAVGNHEFDWIKDPGSYYFGDWEADGGFTFLASNIVDKKTGKLAGFAKPYAVVEAGGVRIGVIGAATKYTGEVVLAKNIEGLSFLDAAEGAAKYLDELKKTCNAVIVLGHVGARQDAPEGPVTDEAADLARALPELAGIISGHTHTVVNGRVAGVPIIQAGANGQNIGRLALNFNAEGRLTGVDTEIINLSGEAAKAAAPVDQSVAASLARYTADMEPLLAEVVGHNDKALETKPEVAEWMCHVLYDYLLRTEGKPFIVTQNDGGVRSAGVPLPAGDITMKYLYGLMPFDNSIYTMEVTGAELVAFLENPARSGTTLISNLDYYGVTQKADGWYLVATGAKINPAAVYNLMCNDFMYAGGDNFDYSAGKNVRELGIALRDALAEEVRFRAGLSALPGDEFGETGAVILRLALVQNAPRR